jgi:hypothetical protein
MQTHRAIDDFEGLVSFVEELGWRPARGRYENVAFDSYYYGSPNLFSAVVLGWFFGIVDRVFKKRRGFYFRIFLPRTLDFDLWVESRWQRLEEGDFLDRSFAWSAVVRERVRRWSLARRSNC